MTPAAPVARFRSDVARVLGRDLARGETLALAVSGGPDSMAMLALAAAAFAGQVVAATVDHRLRREAADEAAMVASWCCDAGVAHATLPLETAIGDTAIHERARMLRYDLLERWARGAGAACLATAHHADDQAETFLMRAVRGSGTAGLAGIRARRDLTASDPPLSLIRPLLEWRRAELRAVAEAAAVPFFDDPSNADDRFERSRVRRGMAALPWLDPKQLARAAAHVGEAHAALEEVVAWLWATRRSVREAAGKSDLQQWLDMAELPRELRRRLARHAIACLKRADGIDFDLATNIEPLLDSVVAGRAATQAGVLVSRSGDLWHFRAAPTRNPAPLNPAPGSPARPPG